MLAKRVSLAIPPGSGRRATPQDTRGAWWDMSLVRFQGGVLTPVGGWKALPGVVTTGPPRALLSWRDNARTRWVAAASLAGVVVWDGATGYVISPPDFLTGEPGGQLDGYGVGGYGLEGYGVHRSLEAAQYRAGPGDSVTLDNWGEDLLAMGSADGRLLRWTPTLPVDGTEMVAVPGAPPGRSFIVTDERAVVVIGADGDPRRLTWCSLEDLTDWDLDNVTNTAGSLQLRTTGTGLAPRRVAQGVMIWCDDDVHLLSFVGPPYIYGLNPIGAGCGPIGPEAMVALTGRAVWMGQQSFWLYDGQVRPLPCAIENFVFNDISKVSQSLTYGFHNGVFPEVTWGYCSGAALTPDSYVTWNYKDNLWTHGRWDRTTGCDPGAWGLPLLGASDGQVYQHETDWLADGQPRGATVYAETGDLQLGEGDQGLFISALIPDLQRGDLVQFRLTGQWEPEGPSDDFGVFALQRTDGVIDTCLEARTLRLRVEGLADGPWQLGRIRMETAPGAGR